MITMCGVANIVERQAQATQGIEEKEILNGAQITSVLKIIDSMRAGVIDEEQAASLLVNGLGMTEEQAREIIGVSR